MSSMEEIRLLFFSECEEHLEKLDDGLKNVESLPLSHPAYREKIDEMFRAVHSIKGGAASFSLPGLTRFAHCFESVLDKLRRGEVQVNQEIIRNLYSSSDYLSDLIDMASMGNDPRDCDLEEKINAICDVSAPEEAVARSEEQSQESDEFADFESEFMPLAIDLAPEELPEEENIFLVKFRPSSASYASGHEPVQLLRELEGMGSSYVSVVLDCDVDWDVDDPAMLIHIVFEGKFSEADLQEVFEFVRDDVEISIGSGDDLTAARRAAIGCVCAQGELQDAPTRSDFVAEADHSNLDAQCEEKVHASTETGKPNISSREIIRVDSELIDVLVNTVGELVISQSALSQLLTAAGSPMDSELSASLERLQSLTRQIQERIMVIRAQSAKSLFQRMGRIAREAAASVGKGVRFVTHGDDTEVDRTILESLVDPLTHVIRNAIDHGIEPEEQRKALGKEPRGTVSIRAGHRSGRVVIEVSDDGSGIDRDKVLASAIKKGLAPSGAAMSPGEIDRLLLIPGFSTANSVTDLSGRGVGMDVVNNVIRRLGGRLSIASVPNEGTTISLSLPLTLAVLDGMVVVAENQTLVLPISTVQETIRPKSNQFRVAGGGIKMVEVRGAMVPLVELGRIFGSHVKAVSGQPQVVLIVQDDNGVRRGLVVDSIQDQRQVVIKSLSANYGSVPYVSAATILGNGEIALILDVDEVFNSPHMAVGGMVLNVDGDIE